MLLFQNTYFLEADVEKSGRQRIHSKAYIEQLWPPLLLAEHLNCLCKVNKQVLRKYAYIPSPKTT